jgi:SOS-response transcriptional repressor LexA
MEIWIDRQIRDSITKATEFYGGQSALERICGVSQKNISRYVSGKGYKMSLDFWKKLFPCCRHFIPMDKMDRYDPQNIENFPQPPPMLQDFTNNPASGIPNFQPVPVISIAQAAEYEPLEPLVDYLRKVSDRTQLFVDGKDNYFAVEISGDSVSPDYPSGSIALVAAGEFPEHGDIVVAKFSTGQVVIKEFHRENNIISLLSRNPAGQNFEWHIKEKPGFIQWMFPVVEIVLKPRNQRRAKTRI